jgi:hypothetical protein
MFSLSSTETTMSRFDPTAHPHKAVRALYFDAVRAVGRTDFEGEPELPDLAATLRRALRFAERHAEQEERELHPLLSDLAPELAAELEAGRKRAGRLARKLDLQLFQLERAADGERAALGRRLHETLDLLVIEELAHLRLVETRATRVLGAHLDDAELRPIQRRCVAALEPGELGEWLASMLAAGNPRERLELVAILGDALATSKALAEAAW